MDSAEQHERKRFADALYAQYAKPVESEHQGQYVAIAPDGRTVFADTVKDVAEKALEKLGQGVFIFKMVDRIVWHLR